MSKTTPEKHLPTEALVAHLDGELSRREHERVEQHLKECWQCRSRAAGIEEHIRKLTEARASQAYPSAGEVDQARREFFARFDQPGKQTISQRPAPAQVVTIGGRLWKPAAAIVAVAAGVAAMFVITDRLRHPALEASRILAAAQTFEDQFRQSTGIVHQNIAVEVTESSPVRLQRRSELEVWSDGRRYASRWRDASGSLRHAVWRPDTSREWVYDPALAPRVVPAVHRPADPQALADLWHSGFDAESIETAFLQWLRQREWRLVSFAADLRTFANREGASLRVERARSEGGGPALRLTAERHVDGVLVRLVLEVDSTSHRPRLISVVFERGSQKAELRLAARQMEHVSETQRATSPFEPDPALPKRDTIARSPDPAAASPDMSLVPPPVEAELDAAEVAARFALHRLRACLGEPIRVERSASAIRVVGIAETPERKQQILAALTDVDGRSHITVQVTTIDEAPRHRPLTVSAPPESAGAIRFSSAQLPTQGLLLEYFQRSASGQNAAAGITQFTNSALETSAGSLEQAWALRRLAERYAPDSVHRLRPNSRWLLEIMIRDHLEALREKTDAARALLEPFLSSTLGSGGEPSAAQPDNRLWSQSVPALFATVARTHGLIHGLLGGGPPAAPPGQVQQRLRELRAALPNLSAEVRDLEVRVAAQFSAFAESVRQ
ncbi:MAG: zf-HC2 domain-containing protein [Acidobacteria bacterium]|nr:zf-HC2 domain-containing protein [Acidobacteriota bacterium]